ncbi:ABC transporter family protein [Trichomonas vaginalis G3]|uniref:ABC transporter family protein n=1 Tax=Trichomonas vaginalis (strain ATCC PRA-98 / G3) TaxID=412133 RepID=A2E808_TRIV3|nr:ABC transporter B family [Trichomonas vaginalis G3]EAY11234.1 ABC transporter family protein [Trichomonas vaginalis G3]KAI5551378.1 ABC transporter B family [Trichomonas vaginalis G3]|eukprot:XP_001323457.1 ABC transporter family protein [Trichomonas vaginalis G3]
MPPQFKVFKTQGSQDDKDVKTTGFEMCVMLKFFENKCMFAITVILMACAGMVPLMMYFFMGDITSEMSNGNTEIVKAILPTIYRMAYINVAMLFFMLVSQSLKSYCVPKFATDVRVKIYSSLVNQSIDYFDQQSTGVLVSRLSEDVTLIRETYIDKFLQVIQSSVQAIGGIVLSFISSWRVSLICLVAIPIVLVTFWLGEFYVGKLWYKYNERSTTAASKAEEVITQFRTVKAFDGEMKEYDAYTSSLDGVDDVYTTTSIVHGVKDGVISFFANAMIAAVLYFTSYFIIKKPSYGIRAGDALVLMMSLMFATMGFTQVFSSIDDFRKANISSRKVLEIIEKVPDIDRKQGETLSDVKGAIEFKNVGFHYSTRQEYAVRNLSFSIQPGETVALVGESGCGKTTTLQLLQRFYEVTEGEILLDGKNIKDLSQVFLRSQIVTVPQIPVLFSMSIADNIRYSKPDASDDDVAQAADVGNAHNFIMTMEKNYKTEVQQTSLSGGQKQRICISRAILANAPILLLDEATAALDTESEQLVQKSLEKVRKGKTAIVVAHRLATVKNADRILVFQNGKIVESGKHEELLKANGIYSDLVKFQLQ